jgi:hypothetical protein
MDQLLSHILQAHGCVTECGVRDTAVGRHRRSQCTAAAAPAGGGTLLSRSRPTYHRLGMQTPSARVS